MSVRFQRRIRLLPGVTLNIGKTGVSVTIGVRGARWTIGHAATPRAWVCPGRACPIASKSPTTAR